MPTITMTIYRPDAAGGDDLEIEVGITGRIYRGTGTPDDPSEVEDIVATTTGHDPHVIELTEDEEMEAERRMLEATE